MEIRPEQPGDERAISVLIGHAFSFAEHSVGTEAAIVERLRQAKSLTLSLVAEEQEAIVGHAAFSPVTIGDADLGWFGLGPVAVHPDWQGLGTGGLLIRQGLDQLRMNGAVGCVVLGEPAFYGRFGFAADERLRFPGPPPKYFQALAFRGEVPSGPVAYHPAFG